MDGWTDIATDGGALTPKAASVEPDDTNWLQHDRTKAPAARRDGGSGAPKWTLCCSVRTKKRLPRTTFRSSPRETSFSGNAEVSREEARRPWRRHRLAPGFHSERSERLGHTAHYRHHLEQCLSLTRHMKRAAGGLKKKKKKRSPRDAATSQGGNFF